MKNLAGEGRMVQQTAAEEFFDHNLRVTGHSKRLIKLRGRLQEVVRAMAPEPK